MDSMTLIAVASIATAGLTTGIGCMCPALGEGRSVSTALTAGALFGLPVLAAKLAEIMHAAHNNDLPLL